MVRVAPHSGAERFASSNRMHGKCDFRASTICRLTQPYNERHFDCVQKRSVLRTAMVRIRGERAFGLSSFVRERRAAQAHSHRYIEKKMTAPAITYKR
jgi:hypothetical protein